MGANCIGKTAACKKCEEDCKGNNECMLSCYRKYANTNEHFTIDNNSMILIIIIIIVLWFFFYQRKKLK